MGEPAIDLVLLRSVGPRDGRYLKENLALLRPGPDVAVSTLYRRRWVAPEFHAAEPPLAGRRAAIVCFDYGAGLCQAVRAARVIDAAWCGGALRLRLLAGAFLIPKAPLDGAAIPRSAGEPSEPGEHRPADGQGPHRFVFPLPAAWREAWEEFPADDWSAWRHVVRLLAGHPGSPYASCRFLAARPIETLRDGGGGPAGQGPELAWEVLVEEAPGLPPQDVAVRLVACQGDLRAASREAAVTTGRPARLTLDLDRVRPEKPLSVELFLPGLADTAAPLTWEIAWPGAGAAPEPAAPRREVRPALLEETLGHLQPRGDDQRALIRQLLAGLRRHGGVAPWLVGQLLDWDMPGEAAGLLETHPSLAREAADLELGIWLGVFGRAARRLPGAAEKIVVARAGAGAPAELAGSLLEYLGRHPDAVFWEVLAWLGLPPNRPGADALVDHPFGQALFLAGRLDELLAQLAQRAAAAHPSAKAWIASVLGDFPAWAEFVADLERRALLGGEGWVAPERVLPGLGPEDAARWIARSGPGGAPYAAAAGWYWRERHRLVQADPDLWAEIALALRARSPEEDLPAWEAELADAALAGGDVLLAVHLLARAGTSALDAERHASLEEFLAREPAAAALAGIERLREHLAGRRFLLLGGHYPPEWVAPLEEELGISIVVKCMERDGAYSAHDIPAGVDGCFLLRWTGHDAYHAASARLGPGRVRFLRGTGRRAFLAALRELAETPPAN